MDKVERLQPDLVLASLSVPGMEKNIEQLQKRHIPHIILNPNSFHQIADDIETVGEALGCPKLGQERAKNFRDEVRGFKKEAKRRSQKPSLYWEWWPKPVFTPGKSNWLTEMSELAGAYNVYATEHEANFQTDWEDVKRRNPDYIFLVWPGVNREKVDPTSLLKRPGWKEMKAVRQNEIHVLDDSFFCRPSPRLLIGLEKIIQLLSDQSLPKQ